MSGSVTVDGALDADSITLKAEDIREAIGLGKDQFIPPLACKLRFYVPLPKTPLTDTTRLFFRISRQHHALL